MTDRTFGRTVGINPDAPASRVRLRLARPNDSLAVQRLLEAAGVEVSGFQLRSVLGFNPARRLVLAAVAPIDGTETLVGLGSIDLEPDADVDTIVVDPHLTDGLAPVLRDALLRRARGTRPRGGGLRAA